LLGVELGCRFKGQQISDQLTGALGRPTFIDGQKDGAVLRSLVDVGGEMIMADGIEKSADQLGKALGGIQRSGIARGRQTEGFAPLSQVRAALQGITEPLRVEMKPDRRRGADFCVAANDARFEDEGHACLLKVSPNRADQWNPIVRRFAAPAPGESIEWEAGPRAGFPCAGTRRSAEAGAD